MQQKESSELDAKTTQKVQEDGGQVDNGLAQEHNRAQHNTGALARNE